MIRQAVILAGGKGKRMRKGTSDPELLSTPKQLLKINGVPIIEKHVKALSKEGIETVIVANNDNKAAFQEALKGYDVKYVTQEEPLGTANALYQAKDYINSDSFLVIMGDDIAEYDISKIKTMEDPTVFAYEVDDLSSYGAVVTDDKGLVKEIKEKSVKGRGLANSGIYVMPIDFFDVYGNIPINEGSGEFYLTDAIKILKDRGTSFNVEKLDLWMGINTPEELKAAREKLENETR